MYKELITEDRQVINRKFTSPKSVDCFKSISWWGLGIVSRDPEIPGKPLIFLFGKNSRIREYTHVIYFIPVKAHICYK